MGGGAEGERGTRGGGKMGAIALGVGLWGKAQVGKGWRRGAQEGQKVKARGK